MSHYEEQQIKLSEIEIEIQIQIDQKMQRKDGNWYLSIAAYILETFETCLPDCFSQQTLRPHTRFQSES